MLWERRTKLKNRLILLDKMILKTARLILRPLKDSDAQSVVENANNLNVSRWLLKMPYPYRMKDAREWIRHTKEYSWKRPIEDYVFGIGLKPEHNIIGAIGIHHIDRNQGIGEVGYWLGERYHGKGYGSEFLKAVVDFAFNRIKLRRLEAGVFDGNPASGRLLEKVGFAHEGKKLQAKKCKATGEIHDEHLYGLLKENYSRRTK